jgi:hypothetical protein
VGNDPVSYFDPTGELFWVPLLVAAWGVYEIGSAAYDIYNALRTLVDPCASAGVKVVVVGLAAASVFGPGGGFTALTKPRVASRKLQNIVDDLYKGVRNPERLGNGTTMDAIRHERLWNEPVHGRWHLQKGEQYATGLQNWLNANPGASYHDRLVAQSILDDLLSALGSR